MRNELLASDDSISISEYGYFSGILGADCGIVKELWEAKIDASEPRLFYYVARCGPHLDLLGFTRTSVTGSGAGLTRDIASTAAVGETIERYCASLLPEAPILTAREIGCQALDLSRLSLFSGTQYDSGKCRYARPSPDLPLRWEWMTSAGAQQQVAVPLELIFVAHAPSGTKHISPGLSTGVACSDNPYDAITKGALECIERDAFNIVWLNRLRMPRLDVAGVDTRLDAVTADAKRCGLDLAFVLITLDIAVPVVMCTVRTKSGRPGAIAVGAAARLDPIEAAIKAAVEALHTRLWLLMMRPHKRVTAVSQIRDFDDHVMFYDDERNATRAAFLTSSTDVMSLASLPRINGDASPAMLDEVVQRLGTTHLELLFRDLTTPDVASCGLHVYKAFIPGAQNINADHAHRFLGGRRLYDVPVNLGLLSSSPTEAELNNDPHPFP